MSFIDIVDDAKYVTMVIENMLQKFNYRCRSFNDPLEYIKKLKEEWTEEELPSLILLDLMMPKLNGYEIISIVRNDQKLKNIPIIVVSIKSQIDDIFNCIKIGANDYIIKPFETTLLLNKINKYLNSSKN